MAVFVCAADESADENPRRSFFYGGFSAPVDDWNESFSPAWKERVLDGPPSIPYLHMADIRSTAWCREYGLTLRDVNVRLDEAARVIRSAGSLIPTICHLDRAEHDRILRQPFLPNGRRRTASLEPDYICFLVFTLQQLQLIRDRYPEAERVDFWVEQNGQITRFLKDFHADSAEAIRATSHPELASLVGQFKPVPKANVHTQAADVLTWHARKAHRKTLDRDGWRRYARMVDSGRRYGSLEQIQPRLLQRLADGFAARIAAADAVTAESESDS